MRMYPMSHRLRLNRARRRFRFELLLLAGLAWAAGVWTVWPG